MATPSQKSVKRMLPLRGVRDFIDKIPLPTTGRAAYHDPRILGLQLRITSSGVRTWIWAYRNPEPKKFTIGRWPRISDATARERAQIAQRALDLDGTDPNEAKAAKRAAQKAARTAKRARRHESTGPDVGSFKSILDAYLSHLGGEVLKGERSQVTLDEVRRIMTKEGAAWMNRPMAAIGEDEIFRQMDAIRERGAKVAANRFLSWSKAVWQWAVTHRKLVDANGVTIKVSPLLGLKKLEKEAERKRVLRRNEIVPFWQATATLEQPWRTFYRFLLLTGQRLNEVAQMEWREVDGSTWSIPASRTGNKVGEPHTVHLSAPALEALAELPRTSERFVFSLDGEHPVTGFNRAKWRLDTAMNVATGQAPTQTYVSPFELDAKRKESHGGFTNHDLRRSMSTGVGELGFAPHIVDLVLGHKLGGPYNHAQLHAERDKAMEAWGRQITAWTSGESSNVVPMRMAHS